MAVYVDQPIYGFGRMHMCHMFADADDELHAMADRIGIKRKWFQDDGYPHYDICKTKRKLAVQNGAIEIASRELGMMIRAHNKLLHDLAVRELVNMGRCYGG